MRFHVKIILLFLLIININARAELAWEYVAPLQTARSAHTAVEYSGCIYVIGGITRQATVLSSIEIYDPDSNEWTSGPDLPVPLYHHAAIVVNDTIYIFGGTSRNFRPSNLMFKYKPGDQIITGQEMPMTLTGMSTIYGNGKILVMGGKENTFVRESRNSGFEFSIRSQQWSESEYRMNHGRSNFCMVRGESTLLFGGIDQRILDSVEKLRRDGWELISRMPQPRGHLSAVSLGNRVIIAGGLGQHQRWRSVSSVELFIDDGRQPHWERLPDMLDPRADFTMTELNGYIYAVGGASDMRGERELFNDSVERLSSALSTPENNLPVAQELTSASPNPTNGRVKFSFPEKATSLQIVDIHGHLIEHRRLLNQSTSWVWNTEPVPAGLYFYVLEFDKYTPKVINRITVLK